MSTLGSNGRRLVAPAMLALALAGCGDQTAPVDLLPRRAIAGTVTLDGTPLPAGKIQFNPAEPAPNLVAVVGEIKDGKFAIPRAQGAVPGKYKVVISGIPTAQIAPDAEPGEAPKKQADPVPARYNTKTELTKQVADGENSFEFALTTK